MKTSAELTEVYVVWSHLTCDSQGELALGQGFDVFSLLHEELKNPRIFKSTRIDTLLLPSLINKLPISPLRRVHGTNGIFTYISWPESMGSRYRYSSPMSSCALGSGNDER